MLELALGSVRAPSCVLLLGAHCDDLEIGCGGTILGMVEQWPHTKFVWVTLSSDSERAAETHAAAGRLLAGSNKATICVERFPGSYFPYNGGALKEYFETLKPHEPELILTHYRNDLHQDHRIANELTWNTFRNHLILEYEIPKFDGDLGIPNTFVALSKERLQQKVDILIECFPSQLQRAWFTRDTFEAIARLRGIECNAPDGYAEAFYSRKIRLLY